MQDGTFSRPVIFFARELDSSVQHVELTTVHEGLRALSRGMEGFRLDRPEWHLAFHTLSRAILDHGCGPHGNRLIHASLTRERVVKSKPAAPRGFGARH
jgi:hypothetical protein